MCRLRKRDSVSALGGLCSENKGGKRTVSLAGWLQDEHVIPQIEKSGKDQELLNCDSCIQR